MTSNGDDRSSTSTSADVLRARKAMAAALREAMGRRDLNNKELSEAIGTDGAGKPIVSKSAIGYYRNGDRAIPGDLLFPLAAALKVDVADLIARAAQLMDESA